MNDQTRKLWPIGSRLPRRDLRGKPSALVSVWAHRLDGLPRRQAQNSIQPWTIWEKQRNP